MAKGVLSWDHGLVASTGDNRITISGIRGNAFEIHSQMRIFEAVIGTRIPWKAEMSQRDVAGTEKA